MPAGLESGYVPFSEWEQAVVEEVSNAAGRIKADVTQTQPIRRWRGKASMFAAALTVCRKT
jgi:hypothetical protein